MRVDNSMLLNVVAREEDAFGVMRALLRDNHEDPRNRVKLIRRALRLARSLLPSGVLTRLDEPDEPARRFVLTADLSDDFALNQTLAPFAIAALAAPPPSIPERPVRGDGGQIRQS